MADEKIVSDERLYDYLRTYAKSIKLSAPKFHITEGTNKGDNYVSLVCRGTIEGITEDGENKKIQLILKTTRTLDTGEILSSSSVTNLFQREMFFYTEVLPIFKETLKDRGEIIDRFPILYNVSDESGKEILILENLAPQGFVMAKSKILDYPHLRLALRYLGEFHAYSFITRVANPTSFEKLKMKEHMFSQQLADNNSDDKKKDIEKYSKLLIELVFKALANENKHYSERYQRFVENMSQNLYDSVDGKAVEPYAVVNHGDFWTNNMLFKYDKENNPYDLRFIDLQLSRYASPALDLLYVLFCCCTQEIRSKYFDQVIHEYYETLSRYIERAGYDPDILFPYEVLSEHLTKFGKYAAGMATYTIHAFTSNDVEIKNTYDSDVLQDRIENDSFYRSMLIGTFKDLVDRNYI
ncbi:PREDICTED: uncharacterized protein LOC108769389 [Trachymyrmex cornetzi]|uniref:CHK kinase-like domain-containing protein n=1 Tax=Trachymyrmex cornetzi TaxID=471704 RepID=A0A151IT03_9HYME|nr:PREDICTED: uncharacterized protein LOC108769389 [Trachymyrmex cornetzi]XP_018375842.1 PREDICTED: uncharacterized protein LOC108769389 [Trachymyrmex cornetzi]XP_018375843.1 PREDICTED: uncharacterized protein LOC108769389 [Trachymyrmex cornetzi]KYN09891.1 hypothetical protein ALC57_18014 [Trachymyrmex cornetzi]